MNKNHCETPMPKVPEDKQDKGDLEHQTPKWWATMALRQRLQNLEQDEQTQSPGAPPKPSLD